MFKKIFYLLDYFKYLKNPLSCLLFKFGLKKNVIVRFKNNDYEMKLYDVKSINTLMIYIKDIHNFAEFDVYRKNLESDNETFPVLHGIEIYNPRIYPLNSIFFEYYADYYSNFDINYNDRIIIDIGANSGDSALFFASKGSKVYAFEPVKELYDMAIKNINLNNNLKNNIKIFNKGVSYKRGTISINSMDSVSEYISDDDAYEVEVISIADILNHISPDLLKMDCEGCEFEIIENCDLSVFNELIFEYHSKIAGKDHNPLIKKLKGEGFKVVCHSVNDSNMDEIGFIHAYK